MSFKILFTQYLLGGVYAVDQQIQRQENGSIQLDEDIEQRLKHSLRDFVEAITNAQPVSRELVHAK